MKKNTTKERERKEVRKGKTKEEKKESEKERKREKREQAEKSRGTQQRDTRKLRTTVAVMSSKSPFSKATR